MRIFGLLKKFDSATEKEFKQFQIPRECMSVRITGIISILYTLVLILRDLSIARNTHTAVLLRGGHLVILFTVLGLAYTRFFQRHSIQPVAMIGLLAFVSLSFALDFTESSPPYYLSNIIILLSFLIGIGLGLSFTKTLICQFIMASTYIFYSLAMHDDFLQSLILNVVLSLSLGTMICFFFERDNRINFYQRKKLLEMNEALDKANGTKNKLLGMLSHDLSGPLNSLTAVLDLKDSGSVTDVEAAELNIKIRQDLDSASTLVSNITQWSKIQREGFQPMFKNLAVDELIAQVWRSLGTLPESKGISLKVNIPSQLYIHADLEMIQSVLRNIISNGIKFSQPGQTITINARVADSRVELVIQDEGKGMTPDRLKTLFTGNSQSTLGTHREKGHGLGMQMAHDFVLMNNGSIKVESTPNKGSIFYVNLVSGESIRYESELK